MRGLTSKTTSFFITINTSTYSVLDITGSRLDSGVNVTELVDSSNYSIIRCDRNFASTQLTRGGGVMLAIDSSLNVIDLKLKECTEFSKLSFINILGVQLKYDNSCSYYIILMYIRPVTNIDCYRTIFEIIFVHLSLRLIRISFY